MDLSYILNHLGEERDSYFGAVAPPIVQSSNFYYRSVAGLRQAFLNEQHSRLYTRGNNPTVEILRKKIAALAGAEDALVFSSGVAAITAAVLSQLNAGDHAICVRKPYGWTHRLFSKFLPRFGVTATMVAGADVANFEKAIQPNTHVIFLESPNTFTFDLQDIPAIVKLARQHNIITIIDNSYSTSLGQRCIEMGVDIEVHSASKYYGGHSDVVAGYVLSSHKIITQIFESEFLNLGGIISPNDAWLLIRSLRTLPLRLQQSRTSTEKIVAWLEQHPQVEKVVYPFSKTFPQYELAQRQMKHGSGLFTMLIKARDVEQVELFCNSLKKFLMAVSWGGHESLLMPACSFPVQQHYKDDVYPFNLIRFYIGLEDADSLMEDLSQAFDKIK
ncbi:MAG TPA: aminotransferase class I/II-fold pyridoxal phosphate-dependent enzyme [Chitinophagales bacterium]|nr:aminotransferase class I/II-fold pyridoxal phosphate-dependent enzyme [Chitinophagales bacterium]